MNRELESAKLGLYKSGNIVILRDMTLLEYEAYRTVSQRVGRFVTDQEMLLIVVMNYLELQSYLKLGPQTSPDAMEAYKTESNRRILNLLSSARAFLDHAETKLKRRYGEDSEQFQDFKDACSFCYDTHFSYRFLYRLRNYIQHCGMPVGQLQRRSSLVDLDARTVATEISILFSRDTLLSEFDGWGLQVCEELAHLSSYIEIEPHLDVLMDCLRYIYGVVIEGELDELERCAATIASITSSLIGEGHPTVIKMRSKDGDVIATGQDFQDAGGALTMELESIPLVQVDRVARRVHIVR